MESHANHRKNHSTLYHTNESELKTTFLSQTSEQGFVTTEVELARQRDAKKASWKWDIKTDVTTWSEQLYRIAGRDPAMPLPSFREHSTFYTSDSWERLITATLRVLKTGEPYELELQMLRPDGTRKRVIGSGEAVRDADGDILRLCGTVEDITERQWPVIRAEPAPGPVQNTDGRISRRLIQAQEDENTKIANELRDNISQKLCLLAVRIQRLPLALPGLAQEAHIRLEDLCRDTAEIVEEIAQVSHQLHPSTLDLLGLPLAVRGFCRDFASRNRIPVACNCLDVLPEKIAKEVALSFFRILQEALGNVAQHSHARNVSVELIGSSRELLLRVSDDGVGFELQNTKLATGLGFIRMKQRLRSVGGDLAVWSTPTRGTQIEARASLREALQ
jgi:signal transduction histidine kinase